MRVVDELVIASSQEERPGLGAGCVILTEAKAVSLDAIQRWPQRRTWQILHRFIRCCAYRLNDGRKQVKMWALLAIL